MRCRQFLTGLSRRTMLQNSACGFGQLALAGLAADSSGVFAGSAPSDLPSYGASGQTASVPLPHFAARAKRVLFLFMWGGPSHVDLFDYKPRLNEFAGREVTPEAFGGKQAPGGKILGSPFQFRQHGEGGVWISELFPELSRHADRMCVVRSLHTDGSAHGEALLNLHTGKASLVRPSVGAWISYGLGNENDNLPAFITISPPRGHGGVQNYGNAFLPARHQATAIGSAEIPVSKAGVTNIVNPKLDRATQQKQLQLIQHLNREHLQQSQSDQGIEGLIAGYELAFRMQSAVPQIMSLNDETQSTLDLYGIGQDRTDNFGRQCLLARRFAEKGVRYLQVSTDYTWDHHTKNNDGLRKECSQVDRPIAGLLTDLAQRGLLDDTLVIWGAEFGRTPTAENNDGRNHHPQAFTMWMAGGGVKGGYTYGSTDDFGFFPSENPVHMHDLHATLLHALGLDHLRLTYRHAGR
ncbi:MAG: DUF1501 domain-containing protein, partial [Planctomycetaceae bacterium]|nr:DUF1501 domain-containing protein [Planctomycetaceae bacterium]